MKASYVVPVGEGFWNLRGKMKIGGVVDIGTHASLVRRQNGRFLLLDACHFEPEVRQFVDLETRGGTEIDAVLHLHPFHTLFARRIHEAYPGAKLYGTARHRERLSDLPWEPQTTDQESLHALFADDLEFTVPRGVDFIPSNENLHFASVLAFHRPSKTLHVDDTLNYVRLPWPLTAWKRDLLSFHPSLSKVLEHRPGAARDFRAWAGELVERARSVENLVAAHTSPLVGRNSRGPALADRIESAARRVEKKLAAHERRWG